MIVVSLDLAKTAGVAYHYSNDNSKYRIYTLEVIGTPIEQFNYVEELCKHQRKTDVIILIEDFVYFAKSVKTQASLQQRLGYVRYAALDKGWTVELLNLNSVRAPYFKGKNKKQQCLEYFQTYCDKRITDNMSDASLQLIYYMKWELNNVTISLV